MRKEIGEKPKAEMDWKRGTGFYDEMDMDAYLARIHAYYKSVDDDAKRWRKLKEEDPDATIILSEVFNEAIEELNFLRNQLEDITVIMSGKKGISMNLQIAAVKKILDKEFEPSGDNIISRHKAAKDWIQRYKPPEGSFNRLNQQPFIELKKILEGEE